MRRALISAFLLLFSSGALSGEDNLECALPDGGKVTLRSKYKAVLYNANPTSTKTREGQTPFAITLFPKNIKGGLKLNSAIGGEELRQQGQGETICAKFGVIDGNVFVDRELIRAGRVIETVGHRNMWLGARKTDKTLLESRSLRGTHYFAMRIRPDGSLVSEQALWGPDSTNIEAVYRSISLDEGQSWQPGSIEESPEIFEKAKPYLEQCFIARPTRVNDLYFQPAFPVCPRSGVTPEGTPR